MPQMLGLWLTNTMYGGTDMKKMRLIAWLLVIAMLSMTCAALGEDLNVEMADNAATPPSALEVEAGGDVPDLLDPDALSVELPDLDLSADLSAGADGLEDNGSPRDRAPGHFAVGGNSDGLFGGYVDMLFGKRPVGDVRSNGFIGDTLSGKLKKVYDNLTSQIKKVASGERSSCVFWIPDSIVDDWDYDYLYANLGLLIDALLTDLPYHLYWYEKTIGVWIGAEDGQIYYMFAVAEAYADKYGETYEGAYFDTNTSKIRSAQVAVTNAKKVVNKYAGVSDYNKLCSYRDYICREVDYNDDAVDPDLTEDYDANAWQLIWAFDGDSSTDIVCEGYSKAFQYLCDLTSFNGAIQSHIVYGTEYDNGGSGAHMWNIVTMDDGKNYHVDITFVDGGYTAAFLCGAAETNDQNTYLVNNELYYQLDSDIVALYPAKTLKLSTRDYTPGQTVQPRSVKLKKGTATLKKGQKLSLKRGKSLTLKAVVSPSKARTKLTWTSSYKYVTVKDGKVTVSKKAKAGTRAKITVKTSNKKLAYIYIVVK